MKAATTSLIFEVFDLRNEEKEIELENRNVFRFRELPCVRLVGGVVKMTVLLHCYCVVVMTIRKVVLMIACFLSFVSMVIKNNGTRRIYLFNIRTWINLGG